MERSWSASVSGVHEWQIEEAGSRSRLVETARDGAIGHSARERVGRQTYGRSAGTVCAGIWIDHDHEREAPSGLSPPYCTNLHATAYT